VSVLLGEFSRGEGIAIVGVVQCFAGEVGEWDAEVERDHVCGEVVVGARAAVEEEGGDWVGEVHGVPRLYAEVEVELGKE